MIFIFFLFNNNNNNILVKYDKLAYREYHMYCLTVDISIIFMLQ